MANVIKIKHISKSRGNVNEYSNKNIQSLNEDRYDDLFHKYGEEYGVDWLFLKAQVKCESNFNPKAVNKKTGAKGLCQISDSMWEDITRLMPGRLGRKKKFHPFNPADSIIAQCLYLEYSFKRIDDVLKNKNYMTDWVLATYKMGIRRVLGGKTKSGRYVTGIFEKLANEPIEEAWMTFDMDIFEYISEVIETRDNYKY
jgi:soluble lytic murein transglycosylase-like protein